MDRGPADDGGDRYRADPLAAHGPRPPIDANRSRHVSTLPLDV
jgi:hypothetical protein